MKFNQFIRDIKIENKNHENHKVGDAYLTENIIKVRKQYNFDARRLDLLVKPLFVQYSLFAEYALNDEISQVISVAKDIIANNSILKENVKLIKNKIIDGYKKIPGVKQEDNLALLGRWSRIEGKISELSNYPKLFSLMFGFNTIEFFQTKIAMDSNFFESYLEIVLNYYNFEKFENEYSILDFYIFNEKLSSLSYGSKVWIYEIFSSLTKIFFSTIDSLTKGKPINRKYKKLNNELIIWKLIKKGDKNYIDNSTINAVQEWLTGAKINYNNKDYKFDSANIESQISYFFDVLKLRNNIDHTNPLFELLSNIENFKAINKNAPRLLSDINLIDYLPDKAMIDLRIESFVDGLSPDFDQVLASTYNNLMQKKVDELLGWYNPKREVTSEMLIKINKKVKTKNGKSTKII